MEKTSSSVLLEWTNHTLWWILKTQHIGTLANRYSERMSSVFTAILLIIAVLSSGGQWTIVRLVSSDEISHYLPRQHSLLYWWMLSIFKYTPQEVIFFFIVVTKPCTARLLSLSILTGKSIVFSCSATFHCFQTNQMFFFICHYNKSFYINLN